ncbi:hypothetical protein [Bizionia sp.]|uniref:hypothetical protein n=1 Tax=Bizionia sp. TaxID=1954480 RepID=UPI003A8F9777
MKTTIKLFFMIFLFSFFGLFSQNKKNIKIDIPQTQLESGQIWKYKTRIGEEKSRVLILKIEKYEEKETVIHISVHGLKIKNAKIETGISEDIGHLPFSEESIIQSLTELVSSNNTLSNYEDGYNQWKDAFKIGNAGVFSISIKEAVDYVEQTMNQ